MKLPPLNGRDNWLRLDCRKFRGDRPCAAGKQGACAPDCDAYAPQGHRILIIKLAALGDVIRTAALLPGLKAQWPTSHITWVTRPSGVRTLAGHPLIDRLLSFDAETLCHVEHEQFDLCLSLDKEPGPTALAMRVHAPDKRGIGLSPHGTPYPLNPEAADYFLLGLDDELKFRGNRKSYPQLVYEAVGLRYAGETYRLYPSAVERAAAAAVWERLGVGAHDVVVGLNTGAGQVFANKTWPPRRFLDLARSLLATRGWRVALLGGPEEKALNAELAATEPRLLDTGTQHRELVFAALVARCNALVTGDTMALHMAVAGEVPVVALFGPTCAQEIDLFGRGERIVTTVSCAPCYRRTCDKSPTCMDDITVARVQAAVARWIKPPAKRTAPLPLAEVPA